MIGALLLWPLGHEFAVLQPHIVLKRISASVLGNLLLLLFYFSYFIVNPTPP